MAKPYQDELLERQLLALLGELEPGALALLRSHCEWVLIEGGQTLMTAGQAGDSMYLVFSGRLRAYLRGDGGIERVAREMGRGEIVGEMSLYTGEPRSATIVAIRDSVLVRLQKAAFDDVLARSPRLSMLMTRRLILRLQHPHGGSGVAHPVAIGLMPISAGIDMPAFAAALASHLGCPSRVQVIDAGRLDKALEKPGLASSSADDFEANRLIALYLDELEACSDHVVLIADEQPSAWTQRCSRRSDKLLLIADATLRPAVHASEHAFLTQRTGRVEATETLVLLHPAGIRRPTGTREWLERRPVAGHIHIRPALARDMARLARFQSGTAIGLVLAGGGARGLAHLGIYRALQEHGIEVDFVGGTSVGATMGALIAADRPLDATMKVARQSFSVNPTGDFNFFPLLSLIRGTRLRRIISKAVDDLLGGDADIEDLWKNFYCVASNYSQSREQVLQTGKLERALRASIAIPGALPPVLIDGDLLCDGGTFNNFPVDVMRRMSGVGWVIGMDLSLPKRRRIELGEMPGSWALLRDQLRPRHKRRFRLPSLFAYLMNVTVLYSNSRQADSKRITDLHFNPALPRVGMLEWSKFDSIVEQGYQHGCEVLSGLTAEQRQRCGAAAVQAGVGDAPADMTTARDRSGTATGLAPALGSQP